MATLKILVPYNFTAHEEKALDFLISTFGGRRHVHITLFNAYTPLPPIDMAASPELVKLRSAVVSLTEELRQKEAGLAAVRAFLAENGFLEAQVDVIFRQRQKSVTEEILDLAAQGDYRVLVLSRQPGKVSRLFTKSVHTKLLSTLKGITICIPT